MTEATTVKWECSECDKPIAESDVVCPHCGADVQQMECSACEKLVPADATECPHCGASFAIASTPNQTDPDAASGRGRERRPGHSTARSYQGLRAVGDVFAIVSVVEGVGGLIFTAMFADTNIAIAIGVFVAIVVSALSLFGFGRLLVAVADIADDVQSIRNAAR